MCKISAGDLLPLFDAPHRQGGMCLLRQAYIHHHLTHPLPWQRGLRSLFFYVIAPSFLSVLHLADVSRSLGTSCVTEAPNNRRISMAAMMQTRLCCLQQVYPSLKSVFCRQSGSCGFENISGGFV